MNKFFIKKLGHQELGYKNASSETPGESRGSHAKQLELLVEHELVFNVNALNTNSCSTRSSSCLAWKSRARAIAVLGNKERCSPNPKIDALALPLVV